MSTTHTPGPWEADGISVHAENGSVRHIARCNYAAVGQNWSGSDYSHPFMQAANARLIAAAPDQHELLQTFTEWARQIAARTDLPRGIRTAAANLADDGKRLISKATGEAS
jgi:hypothetical protein